MTTMTTMTTDKEGSTMTTVPVTQLKKGDRVRFTEHHGDTYELGRDPQIHSFEHGLIVLSFGRGLDSVTVPKNVELAVTKMIRALTVPCLGSGGHEVQCLVDLAVSPRPRAVICGDCDERITAEVIARMAEDKVEDATGEQDFAAE